MKTKKEVRKKILLTREILEKLLIGGAIVLAASSPKFWWKVYQRLLFPSFYPIPQKKVRDTFYHLMRRGLISIKKKKNQIYISLTKKGELEAGKFWRINYLEVKKPKKWDGKWRVLIFDIPERMRIKREALRGKLKELGFFPLQKSVWVHPFPVERIVKILKEFFALDEKQIKVLLVEKIEKDGFLKDYFRLS